jgi:hypothetical protein
MKTFIQKDLSKRAERLASDSTNASNKLPNESLQQFHTACKRVIYADPQFFPFAEYRGETAYFCTESCLNAFIADPDKFYCSHSKPASRK